jgi:uncharacterized membrane protein YheB (UPF0754 family)
MINVIIYLKKEENAKKLVEYLLQKKLISTASIDFDNISYKIVDNKVVEENFSVITAVSKALLFNTIVNAIENLIGEETQINSIPIVGSNGSFYNTVKSKTIAI